MDGAHRFAEDAYGARVRFDGTPLIEHAREVAHLLARDRQPLHVVAAGLLHDTVEHGRVALEDLEMAFGPRVAALVAALTDDPDIADVRQRKAELRRSVAEAGREAATVFAADKLSTVRALAARSYPVAAWRRRHYRASVAMLRDLLPGSRLVADLERQLVLLQARAGAPLTVG